MDILTLLDELRVIAGNGLTYAENPYDIERYQRLMALTTRHYAKLLNLPPADVQARLAADIGYLTPKVGADAAIFNDDGQILLMQRSDDRRWCLPCGWVEPNEAPAEAAVREVHEEAGLEIEIVQLVDVFSRQASLENGVHSMIAVVYLGRVTGGQLRLSHEGLALEYRAIEDVPPADWHGIHRRYALAARPVWQRWRQNGRPSG